MHQGMAGARVMGTCVAIGEAAGLAAAWAVRDGLAPRDLDGTELKKALLG
jgi:hypothetical protein